jgi:2,4-dienoyl-CoA reductase-like NADH-dependent reductase (Old Yellow Enzyme family)
LVDLVFIGRPALANPHWPVWAAREFGHPDPFSHRTGRLGMVAAQLEAIGWPPLPTPSDGLKSSAR